MIEFIGLETIKIGFVEECNSQHKNDAMVGTFFVHLSRSKLKKYHIWCN